MENETTATEMAETGELAGMLLDDRKALEAELREERRVRAEEMRARRDEAMRAQMDLIRGLVEGGDQRPPPTHDPKVAKLMVMFERLMTAYEVPENPPQRAYAALNGSGYTEVKEAILRRYDVNETYALMKTGETTRELHVRLTKKWTKDVEKCSGAGTVCQYPSSKCPSVGAGAGA